MKMIQQQQKNKFLFVYYIQKGEMRVSIGLPGDMAVPIIIIVGERVSKWTRLGK